MENQKLTPLKAITLFKVEKARDSDEKYYAETTNLRISKCGQYYETSGQQPAKVEDLSIFAKMFDQAKRGKSVLIDTFTEYVIRANWKEINDYGLREKTLDMWWHSPAGLTTMYFDKSLTIKSGKYHMPRLLWNYSKGKLYVFAIKEYPRRDTPLFRAPLMNVDSKGLVCLGSTKIVINRKSESLDEVARLIMNAFFKSEFTHTNGGNPTLIPIESVYDQSKKENFPLESLSPMHQTVKELCIR